MIQVGTQNSTLSKSPKTIDVTMTRGPVQGHGHDGHLRDRRRHAESLLRPQGKKRPTEFKSTPGSKNFVNIHKRVKK